MYCITIYDEHYDKIKKLGYVPVGLGEKIKSNKFLTDKSLHNISKKNSYYGEYTFHYWLWKNNIISEKIIGLVFVSTENFGSRIK